MAFIARRRTGAFDVVRRGGATGWVRFSRGPGLYDQGFRFGGGDGGGARRHDRFCWSALVVHGQHCWLVRSGVDLFHRHSGIVSS